MCWEESHFGSTVRKGNFIRRVQHTIRNQEFGCGGTLNLWRSYGMWILLPLWKQLPSPVSPCSFLGSSEVSLSHGCHILRNIVTHATRGDMIFCWHSYCGKSRTTNIPYNGTTFFQTLNLQQPIYKHLYTGTSLFLTKKRCNNFCVQGTVENWYFHIHIWLVLLQNTNWAIVWCLVVVFFSLFFLRPPPPPPPWKEMKRSGTWIKCKFKNEESPLQRNCLLGA